MGGIKFVIEETSRRHFLSAAFIKLQVPSKLFYKYMLSSTAQEAHQKDTSRPQHLHLHSTPLLSASKSNFQRTSLQLMSDNHRHHCLRQRLQCHEWYFQPKKKNDPILPQTAWNKRQKLIFFYIPGEIPLLVSLITNNISITILLQHHKCPQNFS